MPVAIQLLLAETFREWLKDNPFRLAAALAYYAFFSLVPVLIILTAFGSTFFGDAAVSGSLAGQLSSVVGSRAANAVQSTIAFAYGSSSISAFVFGIGLLIMAATAVFVQLEGIFDTIWARHSHRGFLKSVEHRLSSLLLIPAVTLLFLLWLGFSSVLPAFVIFLKDFLPVSPFVVNLFNALLLLLVSSLLFAVVYRMVAPVRLAWHDVWLGSAFTAALLTLGQYVLAFYLSKSTVLSFYGALGSVAILLLWLYFSAHLFLFGAEFTKVYASIHGSHRKKQRD